MKVYIGVPAYGQIYPEFLTSIVKLVTLLHLAGDDVELDLVSDCSLIAKARSEIANRFLASGYDKLFFIDADIGFDVSDAFFLLNSPAEVIGGPYVQKRMDAVVFNVKPNDFVGTGFMKIERSALERLAPHMPTVAGLPYFFNCGIVDGEYVGEDVSFCRAWRAIGGTIDVYTCKLVHFGRHGYSADYQAWLKATHG